MDKHDPEFQWRTPISFYGRVVDQHMQPIANVHLHAQWSAIGATPERELTTGADGKFQITNIEGKGISFLVNSPSGYTCADLGQQSFEYSAFFEPNFHVPDVENPVLFHLWKLENAEPIYLWTESKKMTVDGQKVWFDVKTGKFGSSGDVAFSTKRGNTYAPRQFDWSFTVETAPGGGVVVRNENLMFEAPEVGYQPAVSQDIGGKENSYTISKTLKFYLKTADGKYAAIQADISHMTVPEAEVNLIAYVNPSGSRNLQYDAKKRISPR